MNRLSMTVAAIALTAGTAGWADNHGAEMETDNAQMEQAETNMEQAGENIEQAAENTGQAIENGAEEAGQEIEQAADEAGQEIQNAANEANQELDQAAAEAGQTMEDIFGMDEDGLIRSRDITGGAVYAINEDAAMGEAEVAEGDAAMEAESETEMAGTDADAEMETETDMASAGGMGSYTEIGDNWQNVGEIEDIVFTADGKIEGVVAEVGGFLDIGDKHVHISLSDVQLMPIDDGSYALVTNYTKEQLMDMPDVDESAMN
ncbi:PRC-barrel domain-containing protein [Salipiger bermudensis]|uniref:PRC-barrel domain-containing protein n=1 Tax=Salipiger bermudensis TaxID=344736 RepID=UPI0021BDC2EF|nr:PRC-barrel domain-containing protein [Salipiger bermudensis]